MVHDQYLAISLHLIGLANGITFLMGFQELQGDPRGPCPVLARQGGPFTNFIYKEEYAKFVSVVKREKQTPPSAVSHYISFGQICFYIVFLCKTIKVISQV